MLRLAILFLTIAVSAHGLPARAAAGPAPAFGVAPVADADLAEVSGTYLSRGSVSRLADVQARDDFRWQGSLGTLTFDNWFNDVGNQLILNSILARQP